MPHNNSIPNERRLADLVQLLREVSEGNYEGLKCPKCGFDTVDVWFTHPAVDAFRTWFVCANCDFSSRAQDIHKPTGFREDRISSELEEADKALLKRASFKKPPNMKM